MATEENAIMALIKDIESREDTREWKINWIRNIIDYVKKNPVRTEGFEYDDVNVPGWYLKKLSEIGVLKVVYRSNKRTNYDLAVPVEALEAVLSEYLSGAQGAEEAQQQKPELPPDFLDVVEGYDDLKEIIKQSITNDEPVHILLVGPPGTAKSLILMEIERLPNSAFITMGTATKAGIRDVLLYRRPRYLIIDEIDKLSDPNDISVLLTLMESSRLVVTLHKMRADVPMKVWVFAAANTTKGLPPELLDRFMVFKLKPYSKDEYIRIVTNVLVKRYGKDEELARYIAEKVSEYTTSVREAIRYAKLCQTKECVDRVFNTVLKYR